LLAVGFVTLMISSMSDHADFVAAEVEVGQELDPTALVGAETFKDPTQPGRYPRMHVADPTKPVMEAAETGYGPADLPQLPKKDRISAKSKSHAKSKTPTKPKRPSALNRMQKNLIDFRAFIDVNQDNIEELTMTGGEEADIIKPMYKILRKAKVSDLLPAWEKYAQTMQKEHPLPASIAHYMLTKMTKDLASHDGLLSVHGKGRKAKVSVTGEKLGLGETPYTWKKFMQAPLNKVLKRAHELQHTEKKKIKKAKLVLSDAQQRELWGSSCVDDESFGESYSMGCKRYKKKEECHQHGGCLWQKGWKGD